MRSAFISSLKEDDLVMINTHGGGWQTNHHNHHESSILSWKWHICKYSSTFSTVPVKWMCGVQLCRKASQLFLTYHRHHHRHRSQNSEFRKCLFDQNDMTLWFNNVTNTGPKLSFRCLSLGYGNNKIPWKCVLSMISDGKPRHTGVKGAPSKEDVCWINLTEKYIFFIISLIVMIFSSHLSSWCSIMQESLPTFLSAGRETRESEARHRGRQPWHLSSSLSRWQSLPQR